MCLNFLFAYEKSTEFFITYIPKTDEWVDYSISFSNFKHDHDFTEISEEDAAKITKGNLPEAMLQQCRDIIQKNSTSKHKKNDAPKA